eukprot:351666-Chlamydomonas_euryale.AAC.4
MTKVGGFERKGGQKQLLAHCLARYKPPGGRHGWPITLNMTQLQLHQTPEICKTARRTALHDCSPNRRLAPTAADTASASSTAGTLGASRHAPLPWPTGVLTGALLHTRGDTTGRAAVHADPGGIAIRQAAGGVPGVASPHGCIPRMAVALANSTLMGVVAAGTVRGRSTDAPPGGPAAGAGVAAAGGWGRCAGKCAAAAGPAAMPALGVGLTRHKEAR